MKRHPVIPKHTCFSLTGPSRCVSSQSRLSLRLSENLIDWRAQLVLAWDTMGLSLGRLGDRFDSRVRGWWCRKQACSCHARRHPGVHLRRLLPSQKQPRPFEVPPSFQWVIPTSAWGSTGWRNPSPGMHSFIHSFIFVFKKGRKVWGEFHGNECWERLRMSRRHPCYTV